MRCRG